MGMSTLISLGVVLIAIIAIGVIITRLYRKAPKGVALVITGRGKESVIINGGAVFIPLFQTLTQVNLNSMKVSIVKRGKDDALTTKDRFLVDVAVDFRMRCKTDEKSVALAAEKLGTKTTDAKALKEHLESLFEGAIRAVAQRMYHDELFEDRTKFNTEVLENTGPELAKVGFELEGVSLIDVKQTPLECYDDNNVNHSAGKTLVVKRISEKQKETNDIEKMTQVEIEKKNQSTEEEILGIQRQKELARLNQEKEIALQRASQEAQIAADKAERAREAEEAQIAASQETERAKIRSAESLRQEKITAEKKVREEEIKKEQLLEAAEIDKDLIIKTAEIRRQEQIEAANIHKNKILEIAQEEKAIELSEASKRKEEAEVSKLKDVELAQQKREIQVAEASKEKSLAQADAESARAKTIAEQQKVITVEQMAVAEREKQIKLTKAMEIAEEKAIEKKVLAQAEKDAAEDYAEATRIRAAAEANQVTVSAEAHKIAELAKVEVAEKEYAAQALGKEKLHDAENALSSQQIKLKKDMLLIEKMPEIMLQLNKPIEKIDSIKIFQTDGIGSRGGSPSTVVDKSGKAIPVAGGSGNGMMENILESLVSYQFQKPLIQEWLSDFGVSSTNPIDMVKGLVDSKDDKPSSEELTSVPENSQYQVPKTPDASH